MRVFIPLTKPQITIIIWNARVGAPINIKPL